MCAKSNKQDKQLLKLSAVAAFSFAILGVIVGLLSGSIVILFDGVYSLISLLLTMLSLAASGYMHGSSRSHFAFGKAMMEPLVVAIKGLVILMLLGYSLFSAFHVFINGGQAIDTSFAAIFGFINLVGCWGVWRWLQHKNQSKKQQSGLLAAEEKQWQMDTVLSTAVCGGLIIAVILEMTPLFHYAVYADSLMMLCIGLYFLKVPFVMLTNALRELLMMKPDQEICSLVRESVYEANGISPQNLKLTGIAKVGPELMVNINVDPKKSHQLLADVQHIRELLNRKLARLSLNVKLNLDIATDVK